MKPDLITCNGPCKRALPDFTLRTISDGLTALQVCGDCVRDVLRARQQMHEAAANSSALGVATAMVQKINAKARALRAALTDGADASKMAVYDHKHQVATQALAGDGAALDMLAREAEARAMSVDELARLVLAKRDEWRAAGLAVDARAAALKSQIMAALLIDDEARALAALAAIEMDKGWA